MSGDSSQQSSAPASSSGGADDEDNKASDEPEIEVPEEPMISFSSYQLFVFVICFLAYCLILYNRKSFAFTLPHIMMEKYFSSYEVGMILSAQSFTYTISKFCASWATDHFPPRLMLMAGLFFTGFVMLAFSDQDDWPNIMLLTAANGVVQGLGWPSVTKIIRAWYPPTQYGFWFAFISSAATIVSGIGPGISSSLATDFGWRAALQIPALISIMGSVVIPYCTWDKPSDVGYEDQLTLGGALRGHWSDLTGSDFMQLLVVTFFLMVAIKTTCSEWGHEYLLHERGVSAYSASTYLPSMEMGGIIGSLVLGALTDFMIRRGYYFGSGKSPRMIIVQLCAAGSCMTLNLFLFTMDSDTRKTHMLVLGMAMGFCMTGAISLVATVAVEVAPIHMTGAAHGIIGLAANLGSLAGGIPIKYVATHWDWLTAFMGVNIASLVVFMIFVLCKDVRASYLQDRKSGPGRLLRLPTNGSIFS